MYVLTANDLLSDRHDEFGIFVYRSFPLERRSLAEVLSMFQLQTEGIWHVQPDRSYAVLARTIESEKSNHYQTNHRTTSFKIFT